MKMNENEALHVKEQQDCDELFQYIDMGPGRKPIVRMMLGCVTSGKTTSTAVLMDKVQAEELKNDEDN